MTNGNYITRDELAAHIRRIDDNLTALKLDVTEIKETLGAGPRWIGARVSSMVDKALPLVFIAAATYLLTH